MGLAGRKQKQRIPNDPRNLSWADDASRFGLSYLSKFGWDSSQGLGSSGDGIKTHLKVQQKLDVLGIGGQHQRDPSGIAWKQNKDFEALLRRLNTTQQERGTGEEDEEEQGEKESQMALGGTFMRAQEGKGQQNEEEETPLTKKKRKHSDTEDLETSETTKKKSKKEKKEKKKEKHKKSDAEARSRSPYSTDPSPGSEPPSESPTPNASDPTSQSKPKARPMAHRARIRAAKSLANKSAAAISEILGIAPSTSTSTSTTTTQTPTSTPAPSCPPTPVPTTQPSLTLDNLTTSTKSVADYFKEKLARTTSSSSAPASLPATPGLGAFRLSLGTSRLGLGSSDPSATTPANEDEQPRRGIGSRVPAFTPAAPPPDAESSSTPVPVHEDKNGGESGDTLTEKQRKAERKAEKRKQVEEKERVGDTSGEIKEASKKGKKRRKREKQPNDGAHANGETPKRRKTDSSPERSKKSEKEHKTKRS